MPSCAVSTWNVGASSIESGAPMTGTPTSKPDRSGGVGTVDRTHLLLVGAGPGLGVALARGLSDSGAEIRTIEADASDPKGLGARLAVLYRGEHAPGVIIYNAVMG